MPRILVVDDDRAIRDLVAACLADEAYEVSTASDGRAALAAVEEDLPDLIVLDLAMPEMDGWRFLEELYTRGLRKQTRVVIVSANIDGAARERGRGESVEGFLEKPFDPDALVALVRDTLEREPDELMVRRDRSKDLMRLINKVDQVLR